MRGLALNFASTHQTENPRGFSEVGENKQLLIAIVVCSIFNNNLKTDALYVFRLVHLFCQADKHIGIYIH
ncbi:MAG: hypothetical protein CL818_06345 [Croceibacter sp.]|nr:hypothetical protein [Croceibacter sp.]